MLEFDRIHISSSDDTKEDYLARMQYYLKRSAQSQHSPLDSFS